MSDEAVLFAWGKVMKFNNGKFRILILADIHAAEKELKWTFFHIESALNKTKPDLVVLLGDNITGDFMGITKNKVKNAIEGIGSIFEKRKIPFALVFGNHDHEGLCKLGFDERSAKKFILEEFSRFSCCLAKQGEEMTGVGNYNLPLLDSSGNRMIFNLWFMDSNPYAPESEGGGYGYVKKDQIEWYEKTAGELKKQNGGKALPSFLFQHIIVPEIYEMLVPHKKRIKGSVKGHGIYSNRFFTANKKHITSGSLKEGPCPPDVKSEQFDSWLKTGDVIAAFFGHDHINDFSGNYKGIDINQVPSAGFSSYGNNQGIRVATLYEKDLENYETEVLHLKDVCNLKIRNPFIKNHGYGQWCSYYRPALIGVAAAMAGASAVSVALIKKVKNKGIYTK